MERPILLQRMHTRHTGTWVVMDVVDDYLFKCAFTVYLVKSQEVDVPGATVLVPHSDVWPLWSVQNGAAFEPVGATGGPQAPQQPSPSALVEMERQRGLFRGDAAGRTAEWDKALDDSGHPITAGRTGNH